MDKWNLNFSSNLSYQSYDESNLNLKSINFCIPESLSEGVKLEFELLIKFNKLDHCSLMSPEKFVPELLETLSSTRLSLQLMPAVA